MRSHNYVRMYAKDKLNLLFSYGLIREELLYIASIYQPA